ncbi:MAG: D-alanyl-lipoteichoic acid biosynthesis protein DltD [Clostridiaceae bacterium]
MKKIKFLVIPFLVLVIFALGSNCYINNQLKKLSGKDLSSIESKYGYGPKDKGIYIKANLTDSKNIVFLGSSELNVPVEQNPVSFFPISDFRYNPSIFGSANVQSLQHSSILSSKTSYNDDDKQVFVVSMQWFFLNNGIDNQNFQAKFAPTQFYNFFSNPSISEENKKYYAGRVAGLLTNSSDFRAEELYARLYSQDNILKKAAFNLFKPYYFIRSQVLVLNDKVKVLRELSKLPDKKSETTYREINWQSEYKKAEEQGAAAVTNNEFGVNDKYYDLYLKDKISSIKNVSENVDLQKSLEFKDYEFFLSVCKDLGAKPYIVIMPTNGKYYDYIGVSKAKRDSFYNRVEAMAKEKGFSVLNLKDKEYEPYYMNDVMHLGWKGWLNIDEQVYKYFKDK